MRPRIRWRVRKELFVHLGKYRKPRRVNLTVDVHRNDGVGVFFDLFEELQHCSSLSRSMGA